MQSSVRVPIAIRPEGCNLLVHSLGFSHDNYWKMCVVITYRFILLIDAINAVVEPHYYSCGRVRESERDRDSTDIIRRFIIISTLFISGK